MDKQELLELYIRHFGITNENIKFVNKVIWNEYKYMFNYLNMYTKKDISKISDYLINSLNKNHKINILKLNYFFIDLILKYGKQLNYHKIDLIIPNLELTSDNLTKLPFDKVKSIQIEKRYKQIILNLFGTNINEYLYGNLYKFSNLRLLYLPGECIDLNKYKLPPKLVKMTCESFSFDKILAENDLLPKTLKYLYIIFLNSDDKLILKNIERLECKCTRNQCDLKDLINLEYFKIYQMNYTIFLPNSLNVLIINEIYNIFMLREFNIINFKYLKINKIDIKINKHIYVYNSCPNLQYLYLGDDFKNCTFNYFNYFRNNYIIKDIYETRHPKLLEKDQVNKIKKIGSCLFGGIILGMGIGLFLKK